MKYGTRVLHVRSARILLLVTLVATLTLLSIHFDSVIYAQTDSPAGPDAAEERAALVALYEATEGDNWKRNDNWLTDEPIGTWYGVTINDSGRVVELHLSFNQLSGPIPDLSALIDLEYLDFFGNQLSGPFPDLSALTSLRGLYLIGNQLSGSIPDISTLTKLTRLDFSDNQLTGAIPNLSTLIRLNELYLSNNNLTGPVPELGALTNLRAVYLGGNFLTGSIPDLSALINLRELHIGLNHLSGPLPDLKCSNEFGGAFLSRQPYQSLNYRTPAEEHFVL